MFSAHDRWILQFPTTEEQQQQKNVIFETGEKNNFSAPRVLNERASRGADRQQNRAPSYLGHDTRRLTQHTPIAT